MTRSICAIMPRCRSRTCWPGSPAPLGAGVRLGDADARLVEPDKIASRNLTASDVVSAIREQNVQIAAGAVGQPPVSGR